MPTNFFTVSSHKDHTPSSAMAAMSSGKQHRPKKLVKEGTTSTRKHRFESFNQRIAKLNIDPVRRRRRNEVDEGGTSTMDAFFRASLDRWKDLNLSENFTSFAREVDPISHSLPQVLHRAQHIFETLTSYIRKRDVLSLEPLLDLLSSFARDLGVRFEGYFSKAVTLVASLAAKHTDVEVIEWSFTCLAWLFKYLSRLLVPDLRPVFAVMAPLLGREPQKLHTTRFAAGAMSFLVRKAATVYAKDQKPLDNIMEALCNDVLQLSEVAGREATVQLYQHGLMTLLFDSIKGVERKMHSNGKQIYQCLFTHILGNDLKQSNELEDILSGVTVALIHHSDAESFRPILEIVLQQIEKLDSDTAETVIRTYGQILFIVCTVRKGTRIYSWGSVLGALVRLLGSLNQSSHAAISNVYKAAAVIIQYSPLDLIIPNFRHMMNIIASDRLAMHFLPFCNYFCDLGRQRFDELVSRYFCNFFVSKWQKNEIELCKSLANMFDINASHKVSCPMAWQERIVKTFEDMAVREEAITQCNAYLELMDYVSVSPECEDRVMNSLRDLLDRELKGSLHNPYSRRFALGNGFRKLASQAFESYFVTNWSDICTQATYNGSLLPFLEAVLCLVKNQTVGRDNINSLVDVLIENTHSSSHELRKLSLQILHSLYATKHGEDAEVLATALSIENSPLELQSARAISMQVRKLASLYDSASSHDWLQKVVPHFCFGMLTYKFSQIWDDTTMALKQICATKIGEEVVASLAFEWLQERDGTNVDNDTPNPARVQPGPLTAFQCSNLLHVENLINNDVSEVKAADQYLQKQYDTVHTLLSRKVRDAPALALRVLLANPHVAEKRSRLLTPMFLTWALNESRDITNSAETGEAEGTDPTVYRLKGRDQKVMLDLFGSFLNPKVLYRSSDVFGALQQLLTTGDVEIQTSALRALFNWKLPEIQPYHENLLNLLDEARFRDELIVFLHVDEQNSIIQREHRSELMPIVLRLLYGRVISGTGNGSKGQAAKRKVVLEALSRLDAQYLEDFIHLTLGHLSNIKLFDRDCLDESTLGQEIVNPRSQVGLVNMMRDALEILGDRLSPFTQCISSAILYCLIRAARILSVQKDDTVQLHQKDLQTSLLKVVRQTGLQCINLIFRSSSTSMPSFYVSTIFKELLSPRLERLPVETAQSVSGVLQLFSTWASSRGSALLLVEYDPRTITSIVDCLVVPSAKDEVKMFVLDEILNKIVRISKPLEVQGPEDTNDGIPEMISQKVLQPNMDSLLTRAGSLLRASPSKELLISVIQLLSTLAPLVEGSSQTINLLENCTFLLDQPSHRVSPRSKGELLSIVKHFVPFVESQSESCLWNHIVSTVTSLFGYFKDRENRMILSQVLSVLAEKDYDLKDVAQLSLSLNAYSKARIEEPDFDERLKAFNAINEVRFKQFNAKQWRPILYNMLFYVKDSEELAIRTNASYALRRFVEMNPVILNDTGIESSDLTRTVLLPTLRGGASESSELVRTEYLAVMAHLIRHNPEWEAVKDMSVLLVGGDEEASFFGNILHIQQHRRLRALRRLATEAGQRSLGSANIAHFFIPMIEHFVFNRADDEGAHNLSAETIDTLGVLAASLEWPQFRAVFRRYSSYIQSKPEIEKAVVKLLGEVINSLTHAAEERKSCLDEEDSSIENTDSSIPAKMKGKLAATMPREERLADDLTNNLLPSLEKYLRDKDDANVSLRVPVAVSVVKLLKLLPPVLFRDRLPPVLTDVCHILRSRGQESRDLTRKTLVDISTLIGPTYFGFVLRELRSSLARGYQLHVLSYTVHAILVATSSIFKPGDLDYCLPQIMAIIMDDIFGATGQEKDAEDYISKMREVKSSKSYDSLELAAKNATVEHFVQLIKPLQALLEEKLDLHMVRKIDELLRRITLGLMRNEASQDQRVLVFCYEIIQNVHGRAEMTGGPSKEDHRTKRFLINYKGANKTGYRGSTSSCTYKLARFAFDIMRSVLQKYDSLRTPANLINLIPIIGDAVVQSNEEIQISALRLLTAIIKVPLQALDDNAATYVAECVKIVKASTSTSVEIAQAALKLVSAILRERQQEQIRETDLAYLLKRLATDLEEPDKQGVAFNFLRAVMTRKIIITEVYEVLDAVAVIMVTNQTKGARDMARGAYLQSIKTYQQGRDRFAKQLGFLAQNLDYKYEEGRQSVMEAIHLLPSKVGSENQVQGIVEALFVPLVMVIVNDESDRCREMAGTLLKELFERADVERTHSLLHLLRKWLGQSEEPLLSRVALQMYGLYLDVNGTKAETEVPRLQAQVTQTLKGNLKIPAEADWELLYFALQTLTKICQILPKSAFAASSASTWASVRQCLSFPHAWVKLSAAKLLGKYFADFARANANSETQSLPLRGSGGLWLSEQEIIEVARASLRLLRVPGINEDLTGQSVRNLVFLGKIMAQHSINWPQKDSGKGEENAEGTDAESQSEVDEPAEEYDGEDTFEGFDDPVEKPALGHLITQTSRILRRGPLTTRAPSLIPIQASLQLLGALTNAVDIAILTPHLPTMLLPLHNLTDTTIAHPFSSDTAFTDGYKNLVANAHELMSLLQKKLGTTVYINILSRVREGVKRRREGRRVKRRIDVVAEPEKAGEWKRRKGERKRERRRERGMEQRSLRRGW